jgi:large conductance mechanosensitive channel
MLKEFKAFALKGSMVDMTIGVIVGTALGAVAKSLVTDIIMPPIGLLLGNVDFSNLFVVLKEGSPSGPYFSTEQARTAGAVTVNYGVSVNTIISFLVIAALMFLLIRMITRLERVEAAPVPAAPPSTKECPYCFSSVSVKATRCPQCTSVLDKG